MEVDGELMGAITRRNSAPGTDAREGREMTNEGSDLMDEATKNGASEHESVRQERTVKRRYETVQR